MKGDQSPTTAPQVEVLNMMEDMSLEGLLKEKVGVVKKIKKKYEWIKKK
jgi:hypothetical protein